VQYTTDEKRGSVKETADNSIDANVFTFDKMFYEQNLKRLRDVHHSQCLFNRQPPFAHGLHFWFDDSGILHGKFNCNENHQGYDEMVHGGVIASIVDASMAQCLMGHGIVGFTTDLSVKYRKPVMINTHTILTTKIEQVNCEVLYSMKCEMYQNRILVVEGTGRFYKIKK